MSKSIIQSDKTYCYIHEKFMRVEVPAVHEHHIIYGNANRKLSEKFGLKCYVCMSCHNAIHGKDHVHDKDLHQIAERAWLEHYNKTIDDWIKTFGKNFLD